MNQIDIESTDLNLLKVFEAIYDEGGAPPRCAWA